MERDDLVLHRNGPPCIPPKVDGTVPERTQRQSHRTLQSTGHEHSSQPSSHVRAQRYTQLDRMDLDESSSTPYGYEYWSWSMNTTAGCSRAVHLEGPRLRDMATTAG